MSASTEKDRIVELIAKLGSASEVEIQAKTLRPLQELHSDLADLEHEGLVKRREDFFEGGYGDALELTQKGYKSVRSGVD